MMAAPKGLPSKKWRIIGPDRCQYPTPLYLAVSNCKRKLRASALGGGEPQRRNRNRPPTLSIGMSDTDETDTPCCPRCQGPMKLARIFPKSYGLPELRSYRCMVCEEVVTLEHEG
jgi:hypothetical protein